VRQRATRRGWVLKREGTAEDIGVERVKAQPRGTKNGGQYDRRNALYGEETGEGEVSQSAC